MSNRVHSQKHESHVPFSWENKPGISKATAAEDGHSRRQNHRHSKLPPPPCRPLAENLGRVSSHDLQIPLPPCPFQPQPVRSSSKKKMDDPFLIAYKEVTKSTKNGKGSHHHRHHQGGLGLRKNVSSIFSCSQFSNCSVAESSLVKLSHLPRTRSDKERDMYDD